MDPRDWLLAFIAAADRPIDPVRLQKGLFLLAQRCVIPAGQRYEFEAYAYGPMSRRLYGDLRALERAELVEQVPVPGAAWQAVRATASGLSLSRASTPREPGGGTHDAVRAVRDELDALDFAALLEAVYAEFPEYAVNSVFRRR